MNDLNGENKSTLINKKIFLKTYAKTILPKEFNFNRKQGFSLAINKFLFNDKFEKYIKEVYFDNNKLFNNKTLLNFYQNAKQGDRTNSNFVYSIFIINQWIKYYRISV